jgi:hypothetical protein
MTHNNTDLSEKLVQLHRAKATEEFFSTLRQYLSDLDVQNSTRTGFLRLALCGDVRLEEAAISLLELLRVPVSASELSKIYEEHFDDEALLALTLPSWQAALRYAVRLVDHEASVPLSDTQFIVRADARGQLRFMFYHGSGKKVVDRVETSVSRSSAELARFRSEASALWNTELSDKQKRPILDILLLILKGGRTDFECSLRRFELHVLLRLMARTHNPAVLDIIRRTVRVCEGTALGDELLEIWGRI